MQLDQYMTTRDAAKAIGIPYGTLMAWIYKHKVKAVRVGWLWLVSKDEIRKARGEG